MADVQCSVTECHAALEIARQLAVVTTRSPRRGGRSKVAICARSAADRVHRERAISGFKARSRSPTISIWQRAQRSQIAVRTPESLRRARRHSARQIALATRDRITRDRVVRKHAASSARDHVVRGEHHPRSRHADTPASRVIALRAHVERTRPWEGRRSASSQHARGDQLLSEIVQRSTSSTVVVPSRHLLIAAMRSVSVPS